MEKTIILDTNFLRECIKNKIRIEEELNRICHFSYTIKVLEATIQELEQQQKEQEARLALTLAKRYTTMQGEGKTDDQLTTLSNENTIIATQDQALKRRLKGPKIVIRQHKYFELKY